jgi:WD40 repeat protein
VCCAVAGLLAFAAGARAYDPAGSVYISQVLIDDCSESCEGLGGSAHLWRWRPGHTPRRITLEPRRKLGPAVAPALSPDGRWLVHETRRGDVVVAPVDLARRRWRGRSRLLWRAPKDMSTFTSFPRVEWAPDSRQLVLLDAEGQLWIASREGAKRPLFCNCMLNITAVPAWSPDGTLAFPAYDGTNPDDPIDLYFMQADGTGLRQALRARHDTDFFEETPQWSPDGDRLALMRYTTNNQARLWTLDVATGVARALRRWGSSPTWSPGGHWIAYSEHLLAVVSPDGRLRHRFRPSAGALFYGDRARLRWLAGPDGAPRRRATRRATETTVLIGHRVTVRIERWPDGWSSSYSPRFSRWAVARTARRRSRPRSPRSRWWASARAR